VKVQWYHVATFALAILSLALIFALASGPTVDRDVLYQVSAMDLLTNGAYDSIIGQDALMKHGDFGMGTFEGLDGEMIILNGTVYQAAADGRVHVMSGSAIPYAAVTYFDMDRSVHMAGFNNMSTLTAALDEKLPSKDMFFAIRIHSNFSYLKLRSVPAQVKPYLPLAEAIKNQSIFEHYNISGTIVGIYSPAYSKGVQAPGYHLHFISDDRQSGGHVLDLEAENVDVELDGTPRLYMALEA
jgi:acetolactate decarboxylase